MAQTMYVMALILALSSSPNLFSGTILATDSSQEQLVIVADSRTTNSSGHTDDCKCKIHTLDDGVVFVEGGRTRIGDRRTGTVTVDATKIATKVQHDNAGASVEILANLWAKEMLQSFAGAGVGNALIEGLHDRNIVTCIFARARADGGISAFVSAVDYQLDGKDLLLLARVSPLGQGRTVFFYADDLVFEFLKGETRRASEGNIQLKKGLELRHITDTAPYRLIAGVEAAIKWSKNPLIGGPVDAVIIRKNGQIDWLQRKESCRAEQ